MMRVGFLHELYATRGDLEPGLRRIEAAMPVDFVLTGMFDDDQVVRYTSAFDLPHLGISATGADTLEPKYMVLPAGAPVHVRPVAQRRGGFKYAVDQRRNPSGSILFRPPGLYRDEALISGELGTPLKDHVSVDLFRLFYKELFTGFVKIRVNYVGPEALDLLRAGFRLTQAVKGVGQLKIDSVSPVSPTAPGVWGKDSPEVLAMRPDVKE